ncbi:ABC transporter substrate-binding protein [Nigerium massiliense]|uniref:ABC transporter substrate-binding protein n=1 Tax=Nigerium massiliense TaxID=1522317 RepID=UPI00058E73FF|nr:ABC transporter substrate-binding protein [Nigerium massiliense]
MMRTASRLIALLTVCCLTLAGCSNADPLDTGNAGAAPGSSTVVRVGSASFPESEIIAELYAQTLEAKGIKVDRTMQIGARDVYIAALRDGSIDLVPEYTGNLLQFFDAQTKAKTPEAVAAELAYSTPSGMKVGRPAPAEDKDAYNVTKQFSQQHNITSLDDLRTYSGTLRVGGNAEFAQRPYGPKGLTNVYGVPADRIQMIPIADSGGPLTVRALAQGEVDAADIYTTTPAIRDEGFVVLKDPKNMIMPQNVVPLMSTRVDRQDVVDAVNAVSAKLTTDDLIAMNARNQGADKASPRDIASAWLKQKGLA